MSMTTVEKLLAMLPPAWFSDEAKAQGGVLYAILAAMGLGLDYIESGADYVKAQTRISTATGDNLDKIALDFFGSRITRRSGESDDAFRARILREIFRDRATRQAIINVVEDLGAQVVEVFEPFVDGFFCDAGFTDARRISDLDPYNMVIFVKRPLDPNVIPLLFTDFLCTDNNYTPGEGSEIWQITDDDVMRVVNETRAAGTRVWIVFDPIDFQDTEGANYTSIERYYLERVDWVEDAEGAHTDSGDLVDDGEKVY